MSLKEAGGSRWAKAKRANRARRQRPLPCLQKALNNLRAQLRYEIDEKAAWAGLSRSLVHRQLDWPLLVWLRSAESIAMPANSTSMALVQRTVVEAS
jgi:hypothetical protein